MECSTLLQIILMAFFFFFFSFLFFLGYRFTVPLNCIIARGILLPISRVKLNHSKLLKVKRREKDCLASLNET